MVVLLGSRDTHRRWVLVGGPNTIIGSPLLWSSLEPQVLQRVVINGLSLAPPSPLVFWLQIWLLALTLSSTICHELNCCSHQVPDSPKAWNKRMSLFLKRSLFQICHCSDEKLPYRLISLFCQIGTAWLYRIKLYPVVSRFKFNSRASSKLLK